MFNYHNIMNTGQTSHPRRDWAQGGGQDLEQGQDQTIEHGGKSATGN
jgi:hypothetical protein